MKSNVDFSTKDEDIVAGDRWALWIREAAHELELDICAMDILQSEDGQEFILECNSSAIGLNGRHAKEDEINIRDLCLRKMTEAFEQNEPTSSQEEKTDGSLSSLSALMEEVRNLRAELAEASRPKSKEHANGDSETKKVKKPELFSSLC